MFLEIPQNLLENTCVRVSFSIKLQGVSFLIKLQAWACNFIKKKTLAQAFSCEFCEFSKNTFFTEHLWATASDFFSGWLLFRKAYLSIVTTFLEELFFHNILFRKRYFFRATLPFKAFLTPPTYSKNMGALSCVFIFVQSHIIDIVYLISWLHYFLRKAASFCNFQSMKRPVELNGLLLKFFCYVTWFDERRHWRACKRGLCVKTCCFFGTIA